MSANRLCRRTVCIVTALSLLFACIGGMTASADKNITGTYKNPNYKTRGLYNDDGSLVQGVNYEPRYCYGWFPSMMQSTFFSEAAIRKDFSDISKMGFNSVRIFGIIDSSILNNQSFETLIEGYMKYYTTVFTACREYGLSADVIMLGDAWNTDYTAVGSAASRVLDEFINRFEKDYDDVIVLWEIANEPDLSNAWATTEEATEQFKTDDEWNNLRKPFLDWAAKYLRKIGVKNPISIGAMNTPRACEWDSETFDVANAHNYFSTIEWFDEYNTGIWEQDMKVLGHCRPTVLSEIGMPGGMCSPNSDMIQYCLENDIAYYVWGSAWIGNPGYMQGLLDNNGKLRTATVSYATLQKYQNWMSCAVNAYDTTPASRDTWRERLSRLDKTIDDDSASIEDFTEGVEEFYNWARSNIAYWTPDFRELVYTTEGSTLKERLYTIIGNVTTSVMPYIRTYGSYHNDNGLGGTLKAEYSENHQKYLSMSSPASQGRSRYAFGQGKDGSDAILMQQTNKLMMLQPLSENVAYSVAVSLKIADDSSAGIGIACGNDLSSDNNPGIYIRVSQGESEDYSKKVQRASQKPYKIVVSTVSTAGAGGTIASFDYDPSLIGEDGYLDIKVAFSGIGSATNPLNAVITSGGKEIGKFEVKYGLDSECKYVGLISDYLNAVNYFDNLIVSNETEGKVLFSDSFDTGKFDYDFLTYIPSTDKYKNSDVLDKMALYLEAAGNSNVINKAPENVSAYVCDSLLAVKWDYTGKGEAGFEIQRSADGETWERYWRCLAGSNNAIIPLFNDSAADYKYRVAPISSSGTASKYSEDVTPSKGKGQSGDVLGSFKTDSGEEKIVAIGSGVYLESSGSDLSDASVPKDSYAARLLKKTESFDSRIVNLKPAEKIKESNNNQTSVKSESKGITVLQKVLLTTASVILLAAAGIFGTSIIKFGKRKSEK